LTLHHPLRVKNIRKNVFATNGTPADCIYLGVQKLLPKRPDLIISGMNPGPNLGQQDISYSGTVAGAIQGSFLQISSIAISLLPDDGGMIHYDFAAKIVRSTAQILLQNPLPLGITLNFNIPAPPIKGIKIAKLGEKRYNPEIVVKKDPRHRDYYWIGTGTPKAIGDADSDVMIVQQGYISITPLHRDLTHHKAIHLTELNSLFKKIEHEIIQKTV
jgi:5'-nucleotidase